MGASGLGGLGFDAAPAYGAALDGFFDGAEKDDVHHLAIVEALDDEGEKERPVFVFLEDEGEDARGNSELSSGNTQGNRKTAERELHGRCGWATRPADSRIPLPNSKGCGDRRLLN